MRKRDRAEQRHSNRIAIAGSAVALAGMLTFGVSPPGRQTSAAPAPATESVPVLAPLTSEATGQVVDGISSGAAEHVAFHIHAHLQVYVQGQQRAVPYGIGVVSPLQLQPTGRSWSVARASTGCTPSTPAALSTSSRHSNSASHSANSSSSGPTARPRTGRSCPRPDHGHRRRQRRRREPARHLAGCTRRHPARRGRRRPLPALQLRGAPLTTRAVTPPPLSRLPSLDEHSQAPVRVRGQGDRRSPVP
jgi:hypothetical protein